MFRAVVRPKLIFFSPPAFPCACSATLIFSLADFRKIDCLYPYVRLRPPPPNHWALWGLSAAVVSEISTIIIVITRRRYCAALFSGLVGGCARLPRWKKPTGLICRTRTGLIK